MGLIKMLREDTDLSDLLCDVCDIEIFPEFKTPQDEFGHLTYSISGKTFARTGSGSEYILLEDGSVGFWVSSRKKSLRNMWKTPWILALICQKRSRN